MNTMSISRQVLGILGCLVSLAAAADPFSDVYVIGDSLSDQGNLFLATQSVTGAGIPAADHYAMGRFSNGENYAGVLAGKLGVSLTPTLAGGTNFAFGGARTSYNIVEDPPTPGGFPSGLFPWTLNLERQAFVSQGIHDPDALYVAYSGSNDMSDLIAMSLPPPYGAGFAATEAISNQVVAAVRNVITAYIAAGAHDILVPNVPDLGLVPLVFTRDPLPGQPPGSKLIANTATALAIRYNDALDRMLDEFTDVNIIRFDVFSLLRDLVSDPGAYGFTNAVAPCYTGYVLPASPTDTVCATPESYVFWDAEHPSAATHALVAARMLQAIKVDLVDDLDQQVSALALAGGIEHALRAKLASAHGALARNAGASTAVPGNVLNAFVNFVEAKRGKALSDADATSLIERAEQLRELMAVE